MSGSISTGIPTGLLTPGFYFVASGQGNSSAPNTTVVLMGDVLSGTVNVPVLATSLLQVQTLYGATSTLALMYQRYVALDAVSTVWLLPTALSSGEPQMAAALAGLGEMPVDYVVSAWSDKATMIALDAWLGDSAGRWKYDQQLLGVGISANLYPASNVSVVLSANATTSPLGANSKYITVLPVPNSTTDSQANIAAIFAATIIPSLEADPGQPLTDMVLQFAAPALADVPLLSERNTFIGSGLSTFKLNAAGQVALEQTVTLNTTDALGNPQTAWRYLTTVTQLETVIQAFQQTYANKLTRKKIITDDALAVTGTNFVTTDSVLAIYKDTYRQLELQGVVADSAKFNANARVANQGNGRIALYAPITIPSPLNQIAVAIVFGLT